jgi:hypothetical protein
MLPHGGSLAEEEIKRLGDATREALQFAKNVKKMEMTAEARACWEGMYPELSKEQLGLFGSLIARAEAQVVRLAMIYALLEKCAFIKVDHLCAARALWKYSEASIRYVFGTALGDPVADAILRALHNGELSRTEISALFARHQTAAQISLALAALEECGLARPFKRSNGGGRPTEVWAVTT